MRAFRVAYDGKQYRGFQRQPHGQTVEDTIIESLRKIGAFPEDDPLPPQFTASGRTDKGVSALGQTVALECPDWLTPRAFNGELPGSIRAWAMAKAPEGFHATHHAKRRHYTYHLYEPVVSREDVAAVLDSLSGTHDYHNFTPDSRNTERVVDAAVSRDGNYLVFEISSDGFPRHFVRRFVSLAHEVVTGRRPRSFVDRALSDEVLSGGDGLRPAPPEPLVLRHVEYPQFDFSVDEEARESAYRVFSERSRYHQTATRVADQLRHGMDG
ncbi:tRNA pseudouridine(38-40) synthase TruA [Haladaptatus sp. GCM10025707]|uniref:tRNA pseudouridine(38-40) synthase TruA n=1 Tax=unclassified Haladaptatus TaxID=2622732 RepID=UPI0023E76AD0|nr:tRNA pseudouridine(38-40) synthase TruA [Haladaptatus sp. QDMS2]